MLRTKLWKLFTIINRYSRHLYYAFCCDCSSLYPAPRLTTSNSPNVPSRYLILVKFRSPEDFDILLQISLMMQWYRTLGFICILLVGRLTYISLILCRCWAESWNSFLIKYLWPQFTIYNILSSLFRFSELFFFKKNNHYCI